MSESPLISVIMPVFNADRYLPEAIESILNQTFVDYEFIIIDDGSADNSLKILKSYEKIDKRINIISRPNTGIVGALNDGLAVACGEFIARMDSDDISLPERLEKQIAYLRSHPECVAVGTGVYYVDSKGDLINTWKLPCDHDSIEKELLEGNGGALIHATGIYRSESIKKIGGYDEKYVHIEDLDLYFRLLRYGKLANLEEPLYKYRMHLKSINYTVDVMPRITLKSEILEREHRLRGMLYSSGKELPTHNMESVSLNYLLWASWACYGNNYATALKYSVKSLIIKPWNLSAWKLLNYVIKKRIGLCK